MSDDHFVAQTYLKHFGDPNKGGMLHAYRKSDGAQFSCWPKDVCTEWDGDLNPEFITNRPELLGDLRKIFEQHWNYAVDKLQSKTVTAQDKFVISGYMANLMSATPAWRRVGVKLYNQNLRSYLLFSKKMQEVHGGNEKLPVEEIEMMERGEITIYTDPNYVKAVITKQMIDIAVTTYNQDWIVLRNDTANPFITSDNPVAILNPGLEPATRYLAIKPSLCLCVSYHRRIGKLTEDTMPKALKLPPQGRIDYAEATTPQAKAVNRLVAQCAEELVFSSVKSVGIAALVQKHRRFWVDGELQEFVAPDERTNYQMIRVAVRERCVSKG